MKTEMRQVEENGLHAAEPTATTEPTAEEKLAQLERVVQSSVFQGAGIILTMLQYLGRLSIADPELQVKEYTIALEVFGRSSEFDPRTNSVVRVQAKRLRTKLQEYYAGEGRNDRVLVDLPKGHYRVFFSYQEPQEDVALQANTAAESAPPDTLLSARREATTLPDHRQTDFTRSVLIATIVLLSIVVIVLALPTLHTPRSADTASVAGAADLQTAASAVWAPFLKAEAATLLVLSNPPVYRFLNNSDAKVAAKNSLPVPAEQGETLARALEDKMVMKQGGTPSLVLSTSSYTGIGEAIGLYHLTGLFRSADKEVTLKQSRTVTAEDLKNRNVILLGSAWVNDWVEKLPVKEDFVYTVNASIENTEPQPGEEREYRPRYDEQTGAVREDYALITVKPGVTDEHRLMILAGLLSEGTQAAAEYVTRKEYLSDLNRRLQQMADKDGPPKYYQVLLKVSVDNNIPTTVSVLAIHPLKVTRN